MTAFVFFVRAYAVWIYLLCALGILVGVKMLTDARRLARTTLFSLEQERAGEQSYRALIVILVFFLAIAAVTTVSVVGPAFVPTESPFVRGATPTLPAFIFPTNTPVPTATVTPFLPTETPFVTTVPITPTVTRTAKPITPVLSPTPTPPLLAVTLTAPPNGNVFSGSGQANTAMTFKWAWSCDQCRLGPNDHFVVVINYTDSSGRPASVGGGTQNNYLTMADIIRGLGREVWHQAKEDKYEWFVQVRRGDQPLTPPSDTWKFTWN